MLARDPVHILEMPAEITALSKGLLAERALEGPQAGVLAEVVPQVAALLENASAVRVSALEIELHALGFGVLDPDSLVPLLRDAFEGLVLAAA